MISIPYFKQTVKSNIKFLLLFTVVLCIFLTVMSNVFTPEATKGLGAAVKGTFAEHILTGNGTLIGFMANSFYALMAIIFPMVYSIMVGNRLLAEKVDKGTLAGYFATPTTRLQLAVTSGAYLIFSLILMWAVTSVVGIIAADNLQPGALDVEIFLRMNIGAMLYHLVISGICFCASCVFNTSKNALLFGGGIPLASFVVGLFLKLSDDLSFLKYFTLNTLFDTEEILTGGNYWNSFLIMLVSTIVLYTVAILWFQKKDLPL